MMSTVRLQPMLVGHNQHTQTDLGPCPFATHPRDDPLGAALGQRDVPDGRDDGRVVIHVLQEHGHAHGGRGLEAPASLADEDLEGRRAKG